MTGIKLSLFIQNKKGNFASKNVPMRLSVLILLVLSMWGLKAQELPRTLRQEKDSTALSRRIDSRKAQAQQQGEVISIKNYQIISQNRDTVILDTSLTIQKEYRYNFLRRDDFELMPFANVGQPYNRLGADLSDLPWLPQLGASARHFNYFEASDIKYYNVATPLTELFFKTTFEQGQLLDAMLTFNTSRRLNFSLAFKGFRSLGKYQEDQAQSGNFRATANYVTKDGRYRFMAHIATQDLEAEESGGLLDKETQFESGNDNFTDRSRIDVLFSNALSRLNGKRYYLDQEYRLAGGAKDSVKRRGSLYMGHRFTYETKWYQYNQGANSTEYFGGLLFEPVLDQAYLKTFYNEVRLGVDNRISGRLEGSVTHFNYSYYFTSLLITDSGTIPNKLEGDEILLGGSWKKHFGKLQLNARGGLGLSGDLAGSYLDAGIELPLGKKHEISGGIRHSARKPDFNYLLYQSDYLNYNWDNTDNFENQQVQSLYFNINSRLFGSLQAQFSTTDNYTYFESTADAEQIANGEERALIRPFQSGERISHLRVKYQKEFRLGKWALNNTLLYQEVDQGNNILNLPTLLTRNTLYFSSDVFKKAMFIQTGVTLKYFTEYYMNAYNPLLSEFYVQDREQLGGFPMLDFFINARIRQTRVYLKAEHFNSSFGDYNFYSAPNYPYRDFVIRFGLVWNFFS